ncbi:MAG: hypothetical protein ACKPH7_07380, partial [Planktothrix sp.]|uniref:hypothetical protein n=1 Tax=Planktothrix sp. TaxID=3088171 RepID=UPI0038D448BE
MQRKTPNLPSFALKGSALGFLIIGILISLGSLFPFYPRFKQQENNGILLESPDQIWVSSSEQTERHPG